MRFDWKFYIAQYPDLQRAGINTEEKALCHWNKYGKKEKRCCSNNVIADNPIYISLGGACNVKHQIDKYTQETQETHFLIGLFHHLNL